MSDDPEMRLAAQRMLPVFVLKETSDLPQAVEQALRAMLPPDAELPADPLSAS
jgi:hypothetical protein